MLNPDCEQAIRNAVRTWKCIPEKKRHQAASHTIMLLEALDSERQTVAKLREALNDCEAKASLGAKMVDREHPTIADGFIIIATRAHNALKETP